MASVNTAINNHIYTPSSWNIKRYILYVEWYGSVSWYDTTPVVTASESASSPSIFAMYGTIQSEDLLTWPFDTLAMEIFSRFTSFMSHNPKQNDTRLRCVLM